MGKKKGKKKNTGSPLPLVRLSLYAIVKNEEKNIEKALGWAKNITFEQIVVDTGSTDRTVELAGKMGAKVYHFEWINDFAAARNFAIEQTSGNWIAGVDADEYFTDADAKKLLESLQRIESKQGIRENCLAASCTAINLDDDGRPLSRVNRIFAFRNDPSIRFFGRIHERLDIDENKIVHVDGITTYHTGYSDSATKEAGKRDRNVTLLRKELAITPNDLNLKAYLADSLSAHTDEKSRAEASKLFSEVLSGSTYVYPVLKMKAYVYFIHTYLNNTEKLDESEQMCRRALEEFPDTIDFEYFLGYALNNKGEHRAAWEQLKQCEAKLANLPESDKSYLVPASPIMLYGQIMLAAHGLNDVENVVMYSTLILSIDKTRQEVLSSCIATLLRCGANEDELTGLLAQLYDLGNPDDLTFIARAAEDCGAKSFARRIIANNK
jgi:glycosyltransferase involved in cell wall biosynthesis